MRATEAGTPIPVEDESDDGGLDCAIRYYARTYAMVHGSQKTMETSKVSRAPYGAAWSGDANAGM